MKRLTVHLSNVKKTTVTAGRKEINGKMLEYKRTITPNTITIRNLKTDKDITNALSNIRKNHTIAIAENNDRRNWKSGDEMYHIANQK